MSDVNPDPQKEENLEQCRGYLAELNRYLEAYIECPDKSTLCQLGKMLRQWRIKSGRNEDVVAAAIGVSPAFIRLVEAGMAPERSWPKKFIMNYAQAIGHMELLDEYAANFRAPALLQQRMKPSAAMRPKVMSKN